MPQDHVAADEPSVPPDPDDDQLRPADEVVDRLPRRIRLPGAVLTLWAILGMNSFRQFCLKRYPDEKLLTVKIVGFGDVVSVLDPDLARDMFAREGEVLRAGEANAQALGMLGPNSVVLLDGPQHLRARRLLLPPLHGEAIKHHERVVEEVTSEEVARWPLGTQFELLPRMRAITIEVILRAVIGVQDPGRRKRLGELLPAFTRGGIFGMMTETKMPWLSRGPMGRRLPWVAERAEGDRILYEEIAEHHASPDGRGDILAMLMAARDEDGCELSDQELRDHVLTLVGGGNDTTAASLAWCFERVIRHPEVLARLQQDKPDEDYVAAVVNETLRVRPVFDGALRKLSAPFELGGYRLPAGVLISAASAGMMRSPKLFSDPLAFKPERFLEKIAPYTFLPFGGGQRRCIGASFATMEMKAVVRTVVAQIDLRPTSLRDERPNRTRNVAIVPARGARAIATGRAGHPQAEPAVS
jgi:cytochrome P450 family 135